MSMRKIIYPLLILLITCLVSCTYHLDLDTVAAKEKLVLYCFPSNSDTTVIQLSKSIPVGHDGKGDTSLRNAEVYFSVNGKEQEVYWNEDSTSSLPARCYYTLGKCTKEDIVRIRTSMEGLPSIMAQTSMPGEFPLEAIHLVPSEESEGVLQVQVTFRDNPDTNDYYGIRLMKKELNKTDGVENTSLEAVEFDLKEEPLLNKSSDLDEIFIFSNEYSQNLYIWDDEKIQGKEYTLHLAMDYQEDYDSEWSNNCYKAEYKIYLYTLSAEFFNYLETLNKINKNSLGNHGFSPIIYQFSNVEGGIGVVGGCQIIETEWLKNTSI